MISLASTRNCTKSNVLDIQIAERIVRFQKVVSCSSSISDNVFLPTQPQLNAPNDTYETVHLPKHNILEQSLRREVQSIVYAETFINQIVYDSKDPSPYTKDVDPSSYEIDMLPFYIPKNKEDTILVFQSRFECGNLRRVIQKQRQAYKDHNSNTIWCWQLITIPTDIRNGTFSQQRTPEKMCSTASI